MKSKNIDLKRNHTVTKIYKRHGIERRKIDGIMVTFPHVLVLPTSPTEWLNKNCHGWYISCLPRGYTTTIPKLRRDRWSGGTTYYMAPVPHLIFSFELERDAVLAKLFHGGA
jgi:hypothetical protein